MSRLVALIVLTVAFAPAAVLGALPLVTPIVAVLLTCGLLLEAWTDRETRGTSPMIERLVAEPSVEPPVTAAL